MKIERDENFTFTGLSEKESKNLLIFDLIKSKGVILNDKNREYFTDSDYFNSVINLQMLDGNENKSKGAKDLKTWVQEASPSLQKHYLPREIEFNNFPTFVEKRINLLKKKLIEELTFI